MPTYYPVFLKLDGREAVIIGGGEVAERKVALLLACGARVTIVSPEVTGAIQRWAQEGRIRLEQRLYRPGDLTPAYLAIAATDDNRVNQAVMEEARSRGVLLNVVDDAEKCDFIAPAVVQRGDLVVAVSTGGKSPAMARRMREELEQLLTPEYGDLLEVLAQVRSQVRKLHLRPSPEYWQACIDEELKGLVRRGELEAAKARLLRMLQQEPPAVGLPTSGAGAS